MYCIYTVYNKFVNKILQNRHKSALAPIKNIIRYAAPPQYLLCAYLYTLTPKVRINSQQTKPPQHATVHPLPQPTPITPPHIALPFPSHAPNILHHCPPNPFPRLRQLHKSNPHTPIYICGSWGFLEPPHQTRGAPDEVGCHLLC